MTSKSGRIEKAIRRKPGIGFTQLKEQTGFCNGVLQYHLRESTYIVERKGAYMPKQYCGNCELSTYCTNNCLLKEIKKDLTKAILKGISDDLSQSDIADKLEKDRSTINYHVQKLRELNVIREDDTVIETDFV